MTIGENVDPDQIFNYIKELLIFTYDDSIVVILKQQKGVPIFQKHIQMHIYIYLQKKLI